MVKKDKKPNIIWIFGDQHRAQAVGCNGNQYVKTPNIDKLAENGVNFSNAVAGFPLCCPFRGSLLTSKYPHQCVPGHEYQMDPSLPNIADAFNDNGYYTAYFGKWHLDGFHEKHGRAAKHIIPIERRGRFNTWLGYENNNLQWDSWVHGSKDGKEVHYKLPGYETDELTSILLEFLDNHKNITNNKESENISEPFFAVLSVQPPHNPYYAPEDFMMNHHNEENFEPINIDIRENIPKNPNILEQSKRDLAGAYAMIENLDMNIGRIIDKLNELKIYDDTYILFFSDHGDMHGSHGLFRKTNPYEESIRIPFIIGGGKNHIHDNALGKKSDVLTNHVDIAPTSLGLCNIKKPNWMDGTDYSSIINRKEQKVKLPKSVYIQSIIPTGHGDSIDKPWRGIITNDRWKYVCFKGIEWLLFDLKSDPYEMVNLAHNSRYKKKKSELNELLKEWIKKTNDTFELPNYS